MSYEPKKVFVKTENGAYTEITYKEFCFRRAKDPNYKKRFFIPIHGVLMEVSKKAYKDFYRAEEREEYVNECRDDVGEISFDLLKEQNNEDMEDAADSPFETVIKEMTLEKMRKCLAELPEKDRLIIEKLFFEGLSQRKAAKEMGMSQKGIYERKKRILKTLRKKMKK